MIRLFVPLLNMLVILILQMFPGNVSVKMDVPAQVNAGSEFEVRITLNKGDLDGFSRFQQNIPAGLSAISDQSSNADFTFTDKRVRLIWLRVPKNDEVTWPSSSSDTQRSPGYRRRMSKCFIRGATVDDNVLDAWIVLIEHAADRLVDERALVQRRRHDRDEGQLGDGHRHRLSRRPPAQLPQQLDFSGGLVPGPEDAQRQTGQAVAVARAARCSTG